jgi:hypothetical protein
MSIYGTVDESGSDDVVYDHVVLAADVAAVQSMFTETIKTYIQDPAITKVLANVMNNNIGIKLIQYMYLKLIEIYFKEN